jgi:hypothetical protein
VFWCVVVGALLLKEGKCKGKLGQILDS